MGSEDKVDEYKDVSGDVLDNVRDDEGNVEMLD